MTQGQMLSVVEKGKKIMTAKKSAKSKEAKKTGGVPKGRAVVEEALPFRLKPDVEYRVTYHNGQAVICRGDHLTANPVIGTREVRAVHEEHTGKEIFRAS